MSEDILVDPQDEAPAPDAEEDAGSSGAVFDSMLAALRDARDKLLDRSLRNKLINTPIESARARQVRVFDEKSEEVFALLQSGKQMTFLAARAGNAEEAIEGEDEVAWIPPEDDDPDERGVAARHRDTRLQTRLTAEGLQKRLTSLFYEGQTLEEEQGINVLFLALGFLEWREAKQSEIARFAPLVLLPVDLVRDGAKDRFKLHLRPDDLIANVSLQAWMAEQFGIELPELPDAEELSLPGYFAAVRDAIGIRDGWAVRDNEIILGFFSFAKFLLWRDLDPSKWPQPGMLLEHPLLKQILLRSEEEIPDVPLVSEDDRLDDLFKPSELIHITDADSSQAIAIQEVMSGKNLVIQGPPGTGKSQTITNIIAGAVQRGKRVLFVAEKMAALEVVHDRLVDKKLGPICLELHSRKSSKAQVLAQIKEGREVAAPPAWPPAVMSVLQEAQDKLRAHSDLMHAGADRISAFDLIGRMSLLRAKDTPVPNFAFPEGSTWTAEDVSSASVRAQQLGERLARAGIPAVHPWRGVGVNAPDILEQERLKPLVSAFLAAAARLQTANEASASALGFLDEIPVARLGSAAAALRHLSARPNKADALLGDARVRGRAAWLKEAAQTGLRLNAAEALLRSSIRPECWAEDWGRVRRTVAGRGRSFLRFLDSEYRAAVAELRGVWVGEFPKSFAARVQVLDQLVERRTLSSTFTEIAPELPSLLGAAWQGAVTNWDEIAAVADWLISAESFEPEYALAVPERLIEPRRAAELSDELVSARETALQAFARLASRVELSEPIALNGRLASEVPTSELLALALGWETRFADMTQWPPIRDDLEWLRQIGCSDFADQIFAGTLNASNVEPVLMLAIYEAMWGRAVRDCPKLGTIEGDELDNWVRRFRSADEDRIKLASDEVKRAHIDAHPTGSAGAVGILIDETKKTRKLKPVRKLMEEAGEAIQRYKPVFLMSPLSIAQYLKPGLLDFDLLVIDEASQVRPEDAIGAIGRCKQLVVVGDDRQLPPTNFFNRLVNDADDGDDDLVHEGVRRAAVRDVESILNLCSRFPDRMLRWHYRSEHPALIATSNRNFYGGRLMLPPSVSARSNDGISGLMFHKVAEGGYERGRTARNEIEAEEVAQAVLKHCRECAELSLGVGTFSVAQRDAVRDRIDDLARRHPELELYLKGKAGKEPVFVKNLENIQGDERDVIFISVGYGRDREGRLTQQFGPVGRDGGERRLNVLITRARKRCEVFSSLVAEDIRFEGLGKPGVVALREFLKLARDGYSAVAEATGKGFDSDFEEAVAETIRRLGFECHPQVGMSGFFIDIAVIDPRNPDRYILGVECDGAAYHSSPYARDRDRLRQAILEKRGWKIHRIWSTDWFYRQEREIKKLLRAIEAALAGKELPKAHQAYDAEYETPSADFTPLEEVAEPSSSLPVSARLRPYLFADVTGARGWQPHQLSDRQLSQVVVPIVRIEEPIHQEEVARRLASSCGLQRAGNRIQEAALRGLRAGRRQGELRADGVFWTTADFVEATARDRSQIDATQAVRKPEMISATEFAAAARLALADSLALSRPELVVETARLLGFARTGKDVATAIEMVIDRNLREQVEVDHMGRLRLRRDQ